MAPVRVLLLADTHLGFDLPRRPRSARRRRGPDFFANVERALSPALSGEVDLVVHGGDLLFRSKVDAGLVAEALAPFRAVADGGVPVFIVPGNHERSRIPFPLLAQHPHLHIFDRPRTFEVEVGGVAVSLSGFPFVAEVGRAFGAAVGASGFAAGVDGVKLLCMHQSVEGARVGPSGYTFRPGPEVVSARDIPGCAAVLCGHIHRAQVLTAGLDGRPMRAPVLYPGSVERTSFAERFEDKGFMVLEFEGTASGGRLVRRRFVRLGARPMVVLDVEVGGLGVEALEAEVAAQLGALDPDAVVQLRAVGEVGAAARAVLGSRLASLAPVTMNVSVSGRLWAEGA